MTARSMIYTASFGSLVLLAGAYVFQLLGYAPCMLCLWQRWPHAAAILVGAVAWAYRGESADLLRLLAVFGSLAVTLTAFIGVYHAGAQYGWWDGPASCAGATGSLGGLSGADLLDPANARRLVLCTDIAWSLWGLSMPAWNAVLSFILSLAWISAAKSAT
ncbi:MAG: disulfide bond formation protein B [Pseudomonadota bacterium]